VAPVLWLPYFLADHAFALKGDLRRNRGSLYDFSPNESFASLCEVEMKIHYLFFLHWGSVYQKAWFGDGFNVGVGLFLFLSFPLFAMSLNYLFFFIK
jgi:hypothetical protein